MKAVTKRGSAGGIARAKSVLPEKAKEQARKAATARWGEKPKKATHKGSFENDFRIAVDCYVLDDPQKTAVISKAGINEVLGFGEKASAAQFTRFLSGTKITHHVGAELAVKLENPLIFQGLSAGPNLPPPVVHGYDVTILIDICHAIVAAEGEGKLLARQANIAKQAHVILAASAKAGIKGLAYALAGYNPSTQEVIDAFKLYVLEEAKKYEQEFPAELYLQWHRLYKIPIFGGRGKPWQFKHLTVRHVYFPIAKSNGKIYQLIKALKAAGGDRKTKLFQFLNDLGARALRIHIGRLLEMAESSNSADEYELKVRMRFGDQQELELVMPTISPIALLPPPSQSPLDVPAS